MKSILKNTHRKPNKKRTLFTEGFKYYAIWKGENRKITFSASELRVNGDAYTFTKTNCPYGEKFELPAIDGVVNKRSSTNNNPSASFFVSFLSLTNRLASLTNTLINGRKINVQVTLKNVWNIAICKPSFPLNNLTNVCSINLG